VASNRIFSAPMRRLNTTHAGPSARLVIEARSTRGSIRLTAIELRRLSLKRVASWRMSAAPWTAQSLQLPSDCPTEHAWHATHAAVAGGNTCPLPDGGTARGAQPTITMLHDDIAACWHRQRWHRARPDASGSPVAVFGLAAAATRARRIAAGMLHGAGELGIARRQQRHHRLRRPPVPHLVDQQPHWAIDVIEELPIPGAQVVQARFTIGGRDEAILRALAVAGKSHLAGTTHAWQHVALGSTKCPLLR